MKERLQRHLLDQEKGSAEVTGDLRRRSGERARATVRDKRAAIVEDHDLSRYIL